MKSNHFLNFLKWDLILLHRNNMLVISFVLALIYVGFFYLMKPLGNLDTILIILLFNDPVVTGYLFAGVILLFDKNQFTMQAIKIIPASIEHYVLSKALLLASLATITSVIMTIMAHGLSFNYIHLALGVFGTSLIFTFAGFIFGSFSNSFNQFLLYVIAFMVPMAIPMLWLFDLAPFYFFSPIPSMACMILLKASLAQVPWWELAYGYIYIALGVFFSYRLAVKLLNRKA